MPTLRTGLAIAAALVSSSAFAVESEFAKRMQEDLNTYKAGLESACGSRVRLTWTGGKLDHDPRASEKPEWNALATMCASAIDALQTACAENSPVRKAAGKITRIECKPGKGTMAYSMKGTTAVFTVDPSFTGSNPSSQTTDLVAKLKKDLAR
jgi:hypothetical protein